MRYLVPSLSWLTVALVPAQQVPEARGFDVGRIAGMVVDADGTPWAVGADYKAALRPGAVEFVPALGIAAPQNRSLTIRLHTIRRGDEVLHEASANPPAPVRHGNEATYQRGAVVEHWRVAARGLEQSFLFTERPSGDGDLVVRSELLGNLRAESMPDGTLRFTDGRVGGVHIGAVTGIDAHGTRCPGTLGLVDGQLELRLPDAFVDAAHFPLVLDPWVTAANLLPTGTGADSMVRGGLRPINDGQYESWTFCRTFSASDSDIYALSSDFPTPVVAIANAVNVIETQPAIAIADAVPFPVVVAWQEATQPNGPWTIKAKAWFPGVLQPSGVATVATNAERPALCSNRNGAALLLAYLAPGVGIVTHTLTPALFSANPPAVGPANQVVAVTAGNSIVAGPRLSDSVQSGSAAALIYEISVAAAGNSSLVAAVLSPNGALLANTSLVLANGSGFDPAIAGDGTQFRAVFTRFGALRQQNLAWNGTSLTTQPDTTLDPSGPGRSPSLTWCGDRYLIAWGRATTTTGDDEVVVATSLPDYTALGAVPLQVVPTVALPNQQTPHVLSGWATGSDAMRATVVWSETPVGGGAGRACARTWLVMQGSAPVNLGGSCLGSSCTSQMPCGYTSGPFSPGNQDFQIRLSYQDQSAPFAILSLAVAGATTVGCGPCQLMPPLVTHVVPNAPGELAFSWPLPFAYSALGFQLEFQWAMFGSAGSPCPLLPNVTAYNRVRVVFAE